MHLIHGDCLDALRSLELNSVDSLVTDPPAGIGFMGKDWDSDKGGRDAWVRWMTQAMAEAFQVLKPGAHGLVWALPRTSHWTATALENAGFEIRDVVTHLFGTGFPKSLDVSKAIDKAAGAEREVVGSHRKAGDIKSGRMHASSNEIGVVTEILHTAPSTDAAKQWQGWGTALKPASEHWILVRKPLSEKTVAANVLKWGTGALNIDGARIAGAIPVVPQPDFKSSRGMTMTGLDATARNGEMSRSEGRFPANLLLDEEAAAALDEQSGVSVSTQGKKAGGQTFHGVGYEGKERISRGDSGGASRFFYVAKASKADKGADNTHPTVKSTALMTYLIKLVTPPKGIVLDPFMGSGSTGIAARAEGFHFLGIEKDADYFAISSARLKEAL